MFARLKIQPNIIVCKDCKRVGYGQGRVTRCTCGSSNYLNAFGQEGREFIKQYSLPNPEKVAVRAGDYVGIILLLILLVGFLSWTSVKFIS